MQPRLCRRIISLSFTVNLHCHFALPPNYGSSNIMKLNTFLIKNVDHECYSHQRKTLGYSMEHHESIMECERFGAHQGKSYGICYTRLVINEFRNCKRSGKRQDTCCNDLENTCITTITKENQKWS